MKVKDLIKQLKTLDQEAEITVYTEYGYGGGWDYANIEKIEKAEDTYYDSNGKYVIYPD